MSHTFPCAGGTTVLAISVEGAPPVLLYTRLFGDAIPPSEPRYESIAYPSELYTITSDVSGLAATTPSEHKLTIGNKYAYTFASDSEGTAGGLDGLFLLVGVDGSTVNANGCSPPSAPPSSPPPSDHVQWFNLTCANDATIRILTTVEYGFPGIPLYVNTDDSVYPSPAKFVSAARKMVTDTSGAHATWQQQYLYSYSTDVGPQSQSTTSHWLVVTEDGLAATPCEIAHGSPSLPPPALPPPETPPPTTPPPSIPTPSPPPPLPPPPINPPTTPPPPQTPPLLPPTPTISIANDWSGGLFTHEVIILTNIDTNVYFDPAAVSQNDYIAWLPLWYANAQTGNPCRSAYSFAENAGHDSEDESDAHKYGGFVQTDSSGRLYVTVNLPMGPDETDQPLVTDTQDSVPASTYVMCYAKSPVRRSIRRKLQGWTPGPGDLFDVSEDGVIDVVTEWVSLRTRTICLHETLLVFYPCRSQLLQLFSTQPAVKPRADETTSNYATATNHATVDSTAGASTSRPPTITSRCDRQTGFVGVWCRSSQAGDVEWFRPLGVRAQERRLYNGASVCI